MYARQRRAAGTRAGRTDRPAVAGAGRPDPPPDPGPAAAAAADYRRGRRAVRDIAHRGDAPPRGAVRGRARYQPQARTRTMALPERGPAAKAAAEVGRAGSRRVRGHVVAAPRHRRGWR